MTESRVRSLLAIDDSPSCEGAIHVMGALACLKRADLSMLSVVEPRGRSAWSDEADGQGETPRDLARRRSIQHRLVCACPAHALRTVEIRRGDVVATLAAASREGTADLIVTGLSGRNPGPLLHEDTAKRLLNRCALPIFAVASDARRAPVRIVAELDASLASLVATRMALRLAGDGASLVLAQVREPPPLFDNDATAAIDRDATEAATRYIDRLGLTPNVHVVIAALGGHSFSYLDVLATRSHADIIALGIPHSDRESPAGSAARAFLHNGNRSVIVVPMRRTRVSAAG